MFGNPNAADGLRQVRETFSLETQRFSNWHSHCKAPGGEISPNGRIAWIAATSWSTLVAVSFYGEEHS
ncbi:hypothetical protein, partial [Mesorhizobium sp. M7A.F.Ca.US.001.04.2.1]|uniref:hypothetical protein n=1 Tax=Mesorhizobium sp. M7A.F.Ca.US.001.04.2.1 TaxID=2496727 RepID=UPI0019CFC69D